MEKIATKLPEVAKRKMDEKGLDYAELMDATKLSRSTIHKVINGKSDPSLSVAITLAAAFGVSMDELVFGLDSNAEKIVRFASDLDDVKAARIAELEKQNEILKIKLQAEQEKVELLRTNNR